MGSNLSKVLATGCFNLGSCTSSWRLGICKVLFWKLKSEILIDKSSPNRIPVLKKISNIKRSRSFVSNENDYKVANAKQKEMAEAIVQAVIEFRQK